ncbi:MAG: TonB-dependent receptor [Acidobacteria bacterium]|nr:TonB-dependent receptor [Acidobacteriota bacterium]
MTLRRIVGGLVACGLLTLPVPGWAQQAGSIAGAARDTSGAVLPGVTVEAASPALIEKVRTVVTNSQGLYVIVDLRPGTYTVTFTLPGFTTFRREGIELTTGFTATVNAELRLGAVEETITVTGEAPLVDTQNIRQQTQLSREILTSIPGTGRLPALYTVLPAAILNVPTAYSVGGVNERVAANYSLHGAPSASPVIEGMNHISAGLTQGVVVYNQLTFQEVVVETSGIGADRDSGGAQVNIVPREGSNRLSGTFEFAYAGPDLESSNISDELAARGLRPTGGLKKFFDTGGAFGGPIKRDRLWFFGAVRSGVTQQFQQGNYYNRLQGTFIAPGVVAYEPDLSRPSFTDETARDFTLRLTWQAAQKHKIAVQSSFQPNCNCLFGLLNPGIIPAPESTGQHHYNPNVMPVASWTYVATNRLLIEGGGSANIHHQTSKRIPGVTPEHIQITEQSLNFKYGARANSLAVGGSSTSHNPRRIYQGRFAVSYVTGTHNFKAGFGIRRFEEGNLDKNKDPNQINQARDYTFLNGRPRFVRIWAVPHGFEESIRDVSFYAQDQWAVGRATLNLGVRYNDVVGWTPEQVIVAGPFVPERRLAPLTNVPHWRNLDPRLGVAYDLFGTGRTALKASLGRYADRLVSVAENPARNMAPNTQRTWNDANGNLIPDCDLRNSRPNGECGAWSDLNFGQQQPGTRNAEDALEGFNKQFYSWQGSVAVQHELRPNVGLNVAYYRTWYGGFLVTDNLALTPADYDEFCITVPVDNRLPGGRGDQLCGLYDLRPEKFGLIDNLVTRASNYGKRTQVYDGVEASLNGRLPQGSVFQGGFVMGRTVEDYCYVVDSPGLTTWSSTTTGQLSEDPHTRPGFCRVVPPWSSGMRFRGLWVQPLPWDLQASVIYQNIPGIERQASLVVNNAAIAPQLGRNLGQCRGAAVCNANVTVDLVPPQTMFEPRLQQLDLRFSRIFRGTGGLRVRGNLDVYNIFNAASVLRANGRFGAAWLNAVQVMGGRLVKIGAQLDF